MMRKFQVTAVVGLLLAGAAAAQTTTSKPQTVGDYFRSGGASSSSASSSSSAAPSRVYTSCKALRDQGGIPAGMSRDEAVRAARDAGCSDDEVNAIATVMDLLPQP